MGRKKQFFSKLQSESMVVFATLFIGHFSDSLCQTASFLWSISPKLFSGIAKKKKVLNNQVNRLTPFHLMFLAVFAKSEYGLPQTCVNPWW